jgi:hypothetical protein
MSTYLSQKCGYLSKMALHLILQGITVEKVREMFDAI